MEAMPSSSSTPQVSSCASVTFPPANTAQPLSSAAFYSQPAGPSRPVGGPSCSTPLSSATGAAQQPRPRGRPRKVVSPPPVAPPQHPLGRPRRSKPSPSAAELSPSAAPRAAKRSLPAWVTAATAAPPLWRTDKLHRHHFPPSVMPGYRFELISSHLHLSDPAADLVNDRLRSSKSFV